MTLKFGSTRTRAATIAAAALAASVAWTATASAAATTTIGPDDLGQTPSGLAGPEGIVLNEQHSGGWYEAPADGKIVKWTASFDCPEADHGIPGGFAAASTDCGSARLVVLRSGMHGYEVKAQSAWTQPSAAGIADAVTELAVKRFDAVAVELDGAFVNYGPWLSGGALSRFSESVSPIDFGGGAETRPALYNASFVPKPKTETTVSATPNPVVSGRAVSYSATVAAAPEPELAGAGAPAPTGTVSLLSSGNPIGPCTDLPLTDGAVSCQAPAGHGGPKTITAVYSGDDTFSGSSDETNLLVLEEAKLSASVAPNPVARLAPITYKATLSGLRPAGGLGAADWSPTIAFSVDGEAIAECAEQPVDMDGVATCTVAAPKAGGVHKLTASYAGDKYTAAASDSTPFTVLVPGVTAPATTDFGPVTAGGAATRTVTLTNSGKLAVKVSGAKLKGDGVFSIAADRCAEVKLAPGAACAVDVAFRAEALGAHTATLTFAHDADGHVTAVALTGTAVAAPEPPVAPTPTPTPTATPEPPKPGGTLDPAKKPTLTVTVPRAGSNARTSSAPPVLSLPLSCPADEECVLNGTLTIETSALSGKARAAAAATKTVAKFSKVEVKAGGLKTVKLEISRSFVKAAQKKGIRRIRATLTINTVLGSGQRTTTEQRVTIVLPKAAKKKQRQVRPRFTG